MHTIPTGVDSPKHMEHAVKLAENIQTHFDTTLFQDDDRATNLVDAKHKSKASTTFSLKHSNSQVLKKTMALTISGPSKTS